MSEPRPTTPNLSVVVPVYNSTEYLKRCLAALAASDYRDFDVLVVDDGSTEVVEPIVAQYGFGYVRIAGPSGPARARNQGVTCVQGKYLVFVDADVCVHPDTLTRFAEVYDSDPTIDAVVGCYDDEPAETDFFSQYKNLFHHYVHQSSGGQMSTFWSGCGAMRRDLFLAFGGFDELRYRRPAIEDIELGTWVTAAGHRIVLAPQVKGKHLKRWTLWSILKTDIFDRGVPWTRLMLRAGATANTLNVKPTQRLSVVLVYLALLALPGTWFWPPALGMAALLALVVTIINFDFYRYFAARRGPWFALRAAPLHWLYFVYCGFCVGWGTLLHFLTSKGPAPPTPHSPPPSKAFE